MSAIIHVSYDLKTVIPLLDQESKRFVYNVITLAGGQEPGLLVYATYPDPKDIAGVLVSSKNQFNILSLYVARGEGRVLSDRLFTCALSHVDEYPKFMVRPTKQGWPTNELLLLRSLFVHGFYLSNRAFDDVLFFHRETYPTKATSLFLARDTTLLMDTGRLAKHCMRKPLPRAFVAIPNVDGSRYFNLLHPDLVSCLEQDQLCDVFGQVDGPAGYVYKNQLFEQDLSLSASNEFVYRRVFNGPFAACVGTYVNGPDEPNENDMVWKIGKDEESKTRVVVGAKYELVPIQTLNDCAVHVIGPNIGNNPHQVDRYCLVTDEFVRICSFPHLVQYQHPDVAVQEWFCQKEGSFWNAVTIHFERGDCFQVSRPQQDVDALTPLLAWKTESRDEEDPMLCIHTIPNQSPPQESIPMNNNSDALLSEVELIETMFFGNALCWHDMDDFPRVKILGEHKFPTEWHLSCVNRVHSLRRSQCPNAESVFRRLFQQQPTAAKETATELHFGARAITSPLLVEDASTKVTLFFAPGYMWRADFCVRSYLCDEISQTPLYVMVAEFIIRFH